MSFPQSWRILAIWDVFASTVTQDCQWYDAVECLCTQYLWVRVGKWIIWGNQPVFLPPSLWHHHFFKPLFLESFTTALSNLLCFSFPLYHHSLSLSKKITLLSITQKFFNIRTIRPAPTLSLLPCQAGWVSLFLHLATACSCTPMPISFLHKLPLPFPLFFQNFPSPSSFPAAVSPFYKIPFLIYTLLSNYFSNFLSHCHHFLTCFSLHSPYSWLLSPEVP